MPNCTALPERCCSPKTSSTRARPRFSKRSASRKPNKRNRWNCAPRRASPGCGAKQGRRAEARELLAPVYGWFTEGFDTADLKDAAMLLSELA